MCLLDAPIMSLRIITILCNKDMNMRTDLPMLTFMFYIFNLIAMLH